MAIITTINATDTIASSRSVINTNFDNINTDLEAVETDKVDRVVSVDNTVARFDGINGSLQESGVVINDTGQVSGITRLDVDNVRIDGNDIASTDTNGNVTITPNGTGVVSTAAVEVIKSGTAATGGGVEAVRIGSGAAGVVGIYYGSGVPTVSAPKGSLYLRTDGTSTTTRIYVNTNGTTTWTHLTAGA